MTQNFTLPTSFHGDLRKMDCTCIRTSWGWMPRSQPFKVAELA